MSRFVVTMVPPEGEPQKFTDETTGAERPLLRSVTLEAADKDEARMLAERQAYDIALQYEEPRYVVKSVKQDDSDG